MTGSTADRKGWSSRTVRFAPVTAMLVVIVSYLFFGSYGTFEFRSRAWDAPQTRPGDGYYASLAEGFRRGTPAMAHEPSAGLMSLGHPWDYMERRNAAVTYLWDASYFNGRYHLYFSPLPALILYLPYGLVYGSYPGDQLAATIFAIWAFVMAAAFVLRTLPPQRKGLAAALWLLMLGLAGVVPFVMVFSRVYEVAILCAAAMSATWAWSLSRFIDEPRAGTVLWMSCWLGLSGVARPSLVWLGVVSIAAIVTATPKPQRLRMLLLGAIPLAATIGPLLAYNYVRFSEPLEFGMSYQLSYFDLGEARVAGLASFRELLRFVHTASLYAFAPPYVGGQFPFADLLPRALDSDISFAGASEQVGGLVSLVPVAGLGSILALLLWRRREKAPAERSVLFVLAAGWLTFAFLSTFALPAARYEIDFFYLITAGSIVAFERSLILLDEVGLRPAPIRIAGLVLAICSAVLGVLLGLKGTGSAFAKGNPALHQSLSRATERLSAVDEDHLSGWARRAKAEGR